MRQNLSDNSEFFMPTQDDGWTKKALLGYLLTSLTIKTGANGQ